MTSPLRVSKYALLAASLFAVPAAQADFCMQLSGGSCALSGDLGFFRFRGAVPKAPGSIRALRGRACGVGPAFGSATVLSGAELGNPTDVLTIGITFFCDQTQGQFAVSFDPKNLAAGGSGGADYGTYDVGTSCDAAIVSCALEP